MVRGGFAHRRKMLRRSLEDLVRPEAFEAAGILPTARAEELTLDDWERLARWRPEGAAPHPGSSAHPAATDVAPTGPGRYRAGTSDARGRAMSGGSTRTGSTSTGSVSLVAPAKLTVSLRVTGRRPDGFHLLESEMVTVDLADRLVVESGDGLTIDEEFDRTAPRGAGRTAGISAGPDNLVVRALRAVNRTASVRLTKRIPPGAGLGGGSADAAAVLRWSGCTDLALAAGLGSDVPFCLTGGRALVQGVGEDVTPLPFEDRRFTLFLLPFGMDTAAVYAAWDRLHPAGSGSGPSSERPRRRASTTSRRRRLRGAAVGGLEGSVGGRGWSATLAGRQRLDLVRGGEPGRARTDWALGQCWLGSEAAAVVPVRTVRGLGPTT